MRLAKASEWRAARVLTPVMCQARIKRLFLSVTLSTVSLSHANTGELL